MICRRSGGPLFFTPNGITTQIKVLQFVTKVVLYLSSSVMDIWGYPNYPSNKEYASCPTIVLKTSFVKGNEYESFFVVAFNFLNST
jgi:hypothetical protein